MITAGTGVFNVDRRLSGEQGIPSCVAVDPYGNPYGVDYDMVLGIIRKILFYEFVFLLRLFMTATCRDTFHTIARAFFYLFNPFRTGFQFYTKNSVNIMSSFKGVK